MSGWTRWALGLILVASTIFGVAGRADAQVRGGTLRVGLEGDFTTLDLPYYTMPPELAVFRAVFNTLVAIDANLKVVPELAESWKWDNDTTLTLKLRKGVKFHDGTDFDAAAVKFNIERLMDEANKSRLRSEVAEVKAVEVIDPHTVRFVLKYPNVAFLTILGHAPGMMPSPTAIKKLGKDIARAPVGTGPFRFVEWLKDDHLTVERFDKYWEPGRPYLDRVIFRPMPDDTVRVLNLKSGALDFADKVEPKDVAGFKSRRDIVYMESPGLNYIMIRLNMGKPPFDNRAVRQALAYSIDRESIVKSLFFGTAVVTPGPISPASWAYSPTLKGYPRDIAKAKALLAGAGKAGGVKAELQVLPSPLYLQMAQAIKAQAAEAGIDLALVSLEIGKMMENSLSGAYEGMLSYRTAREDPDGATYRDFHSTGPFNRMKYNNPKVDELLVKARMTSAMEERKALYLQLQQIVSDDAPMVFIATLPTVQAMTARLKNFTHYPNMTVRFGDVWLEK
jgi:peptide/nickel transport system substrate-binding protein